MPRAVPREAPRPTSIHSTARPQAQSTQEGTAAVALSDPVLHQHPHHPHLLDSINASRAFIQRRARKQLNYCPLPPPAPRPLHASAAAPPTAGLPPAPTTPTASAAPTAPTAPGAPTAPVVGGSLDSLASVIWGSCGTKGRKRQGQYGSQSGPFRHSSGTGKDAKYGRGRARFRV